MFILVWRATEMETLDGAAWDRRLVMHLLVEYVARADCRSVRLLNRTYHQACIDAYKKQCQDNVLVFLEWADCAPMSKQRPKRLSLAMDADKSHVFFCGTEHWQLNRGLFGSSGTNGTAIHTGGGRASWIWRLHSNLASARELEQDHWLLWLPTTRKLL
jgi:hypothetical protein